MSTASHQSTPMLRIRQFRPDDLPEVKRMFAAGMMTYSLDPALEHRWLAYIQKSNETDLADINGVYINPGGNFWVATLENEDGDDTIVGCVGLEAKPGNHGELRRLSVDDSYKRMGIGRRLVANLETWAEANGYASVELHASHQRPGPLAFYRGMGFRHESTLAFWQNPLYETFVMVKRFD